MKRPLNHILDSEVDVSLRSRKATSRGLNRWNLCWAAWVPTRPVCCIVIVIVATVIRVFHGINMHELKDKLQGIVAAIFENFDNDGAYWLIWQGSEMEHTYVCALKILTIFRTGSNAEPVSIPFWETIERSLRSQSKGKHPIPGPSLRTFHPHLSLPRHSSITTQTELKILNSIVRGEIWYDHDWDSRAYRLLADKEDAFYNAFRFIDIGINCIPT